jgi:hypothetical protein
MIDKTGVQISAHLHDLEPEVFHISIPEGPAFEHLNDVVVALAQGRGNSVPKVIP